MRKWVRIMVLATFLALLIVVPVVQAMGWYPVCVWIHVQETHNYQNVDARTVECTLFAPDAGGIPLDTDWTNFEGTALVGATMYEPEDWGVWLRRVKPGGEFDLPIPIYFRMGDMVGWGGNWLLYATYRHDTDSWSSSVIPLPW